MMKSEKKVVVICGGHSAEAAVSRTSGAAVFEALKKSYFKVEMIDCPISELPQRLSHSKPDVVFSTLHGGMGENGTVSGLLDLLELSYVGSGVAASALAMNKHLAKAIFRATGLPVLPDIFCGIDDGIDAIANTALKEFPEGGVVKAISQGSAIGLSFCNTVQQYIAGIRQALSYGSGALIEKQFKGREITVAVLDDPMTRIKALPPVEVVLPIGSHFDYYHRYTEGAATHLCPAPLEESVRLHVEQIAIDAHRALGCRHYSRVDLLVNDAGEVALLELNSLPGMTATSLYPEAAKSAQITFEELVRKLVEMALSERRLLRQTNMPE